MSLTFEQLKKRVGKQVLLYDDTNGWKTNVGVVEDDIGEFINDLYRQDIFPMFAQQYPEDFREIGQANSWLTNGTASASTSGTTLVATTEIFANSMVGLNVFNTTDNAISVIESYTDESTVVMKDDVTDWSGDSIYVLGSEFSFAGDASDIWEVENVGVKYLETDQYYKTAIRRNKFDLYQDGSEIVSYLTPQFYLTSIKVSGDLRSAIGITPKFDKVITNAIQVDYIGFPPQLTDSGDTMRLKHIDLAVMYGAIARAYMMMEKLQSAQVWDGKYENEKMKALQRYTPTAFAQFPKPRLARRTGLMSRRII